MSSLWPRHHSRPLTLRRLIHYDASFGLEELNHRQLRGRRDMSEGSEGVGPD